MEKVFFVSDAHISGPEDPRYKKFLAFLSHVIDKKASRLVILGDLMEFFYGSSSYVEKIYPEMFDGFRKLHSAGVEVHYLYGNHDFNFEIPHVHLKTSPNLVTFMGNGDAIYAYHGDGLDPRDHQYRLLRFVLRSDLFKLIASTIPKNILYKVAGRFSGLSRRINHHKKIFGDRERLYREKAEKEFLSSSLFRYVVFAHTHVPQLCRYAMKGDKSKYYVNPGFFGEDGTYAVIDRDSVYIGVFNTKC